MNTYLFGSSHDGGKFEALGATLQDAFESLEFRADDYDAAEDLRGAPIEVWGWDENGGRYDWTARFV